MSGGHFDYAGFRIRNDLERIAGDADVLTRWPRVASALRQLAVALYETEHRMDWCLSGDAADIEDDAAFERWALDRLRDVLDAGPDLRAHCFEDAAQMASEIVLSIDMERQEAKEGARMVLSRIDREIARIRAETKEQADAERRPNEPEVSA